MSAPDLTVLTSAIDFDSVVSAVLAVFASWVVVLVTLKAVRMILAAVNESSSSYDDEMRDLARRGFTRDELRQAGWSDEDFDHYGFK